MSPTARAAQVRSDGFHSGVPAMREEPAVEFFSIDYSRVAAFADDEKIGVSVGIIAEVSQGDVRPHVKGEGSSACDQSEAADVPWPR